MEKTSSNTGTAAKLVKMVGAGSICNGMTESSLKII
jgi:hypothetical protein